MSASVLAGVALVAALSMAADAGDVIVPVVVEAEVAIVAGDAEQTSKDAKRAARTKAIESGAGPLLQSHVLLRMRNHRMFAEELVATAKGVILDERWGDVVPTANAPPPARK